LVTITIILSNLISNVPAVLLLQGIIQNPTTEQWLLLASSATLAGNLTLFGSVANLIMAESVAIQGYKLSFWEHLRFGLPLTILTTMIVYHLV
ncbi:MAG: anion transporter, partial [Cyanobacteria bacterium J149]